MTPDDYARAQRVLRRRDPIIGALIRRHGPCGLADAARPDHFSALARSIIFQQLSTKAASTIHARLLALMPGGAVTADALALMTDDQFRGAGISRQKAMYLRDLGTRVTSGDVRLDGVEALGDEEIIAELTRIKGVGRWTAEMFLMFRLHRPDVLPVGDFGIVTAVQKAYGLRKRPTPERLREIGEAWKPYRTIACWYLWRSLDNEPVPVTSPAEPKPLSARRRPVTEERPRQTPADSSPADSGRPARRKRQERRAR